MFKKRIVNFILGAAVLFTLAGPTSLQAKDCIGGTLCPTGKLFTDGIYHHYGTVCCIPSGPACINQMSDGILIYDENVIQMGCNNFGGCGCKTNKTPVGEGSGGGGELIFDVSEAKPVVCHWGSCDDYWVRTGAQGAHVYYRCFNYSFSVPGQPQKTGSYAIRASGLPANPPFSVQNLASTVNAGRTELTVNVVTGNTTTPVKFQIIQKR